MVDHDYVCPITMDVMFDPCLLVMFDGRTYPVDGGSIKDWWFLCQRESRPFVNPMTGEVSNELLIIPAYEIRKRMTAEGFPLSKDPCCWLYVPYGQPSLELVMWRVFRMQWVMAAVVFTGTLAADSYGHEKLSSTLHKMLAGACVPLLGHK